MSYRLPTLLHAFIVFLVYFVSLELTGSHWYAALFTSFLQLAFCIFCGSAHSRATLILGWPSMAAFLAAVEGRPPLDMTRHDEVHRRVTANYASDLTISMDGSSKKKIARLLAIDVLAELIKEQYH